MKQSRYEISKKLWSYANKLDDINNRIQFLNSCISDLYNPLKAVFLDGTSHSSFGRMSDITSVSIVLLERYQHEVCELVEVKNQIMKEFVDYISPLNGTQKEIIRYRYLDCASIRQISHKTNYSVDSVKRIIAQSQDILSKK